MRLQLFSLYFRGTSLDQLHYCNTWWARLKVAQPEADNWSNEQEESSGDYEVLEDLKLKIESSSRSSELQSSKIDELAEKIEVLENKEKELESENEKLRNGFQDVIFENSIAHALLMQNVRSVQDRVKIRRLFWERRKGRADFFTCSAFLNSQKHPK